MTSRIARFFFVAALLLPLLAGAQTPNEIVEEAVTLIDTTLTERRDELVADSVALYTLVDEILLPRFDRKYAAQLVLGKHWRSASSQQREDFVNEFYMSLVRRYADGLLDFDASKIEVLTYRGDLSKKHTKVKTVVTLDDGTKVPVDYALVNRESGWLMIDVIIEGISYLQTTKKEMNEEIRRSSLDKVIARLHSENDSNTDDG